MIAVECMDESEHTRNILFQNSRPNNGLLPLGMMFVLDQEFIFDWRQIQQHDIICIKSVFKRDWLAV